MGYNTRMKSFRENIIKYGILLIVFILPLLVTDVFAFPFISIKTFFFYGVVELLFSFWLYTILIDKSYRLTRKQLLFFIPAVLYIIWMSLSGIFAYNPSLSFWGPIERGTGLLTLYHLLAFSILIVSLINHDGKVSINKLLKYFLFGSFILAISVWLGDEGFNLPYSILQKSTGGGLVGNSSYTAAYFIFSLFFCIYVLFEKEISKGWKVFTSIVLFTILFSPLFINIYGLFVNKGVLGSARGAFLGIIVGIGAILLIYLALSKKKVLKILGIIGIFISIVTFAIGWSSLMKPNSYIHNKFINVASDNRFLFWNIAQKSIDDHPYFGYGPENYMIAFEKNFDVKILDDSHGHEAWSDKSHNIYFDTGVSGGYPAIALYGIFLLSIFYGLYKAHKADRISKVQASILGGMLIGYIFQNLFIFDTPVSLVALFMTLGIVFALQKDSNKEKLHKIKSSIVLNNVVASILTVTFVIAFINFSYLPLKKSREFARVMTLNIDQRPTEYMDLLKAPYVGNDWDASFFASNIYVSYRDQIKNLKADESIKSYVDADLTSYLEYLNKLAETNKTDYRLRLSMLHLYSIKLNILITKYSTEEFDHILSIADEAHKLSPRDPQVSWDLGFLKFFQGDLNGALVEYRNAVNLDKTSPVSWKMMLNFLKMIEQQKLYDITLTEAQKNIPDFKME